MIIWLKDRKREKERDRRSSCAASSNLRSQFMELCGPDLMSVLPEQGKMSDVFLLKVLLVLYEVTQRYAKGG